MNSYSYSRVDCFNKCAYRYKLKYIDKHLLIPYQSEPNNALVIGSTLHKAIESDFKSARDYYLTNYTLIDDRHVLELDKIEILANKVKEILKSMNIYKQEFQIEVDGFVGIIDLITMNDDKTINVYDFKYSNSTKYLESAQLHVYKYYLELLGYTVDKLGYVLISKNNFRQKKTEDLHQFRQRVFNDIENAEIKIKYVEYDESKVNKFAYDVGTMLLAKKFNKNNTKLCDWCEYKKYCKEGNDYMLLPKNERREHKIDTKPDMWLYGDSYVGKSTFVDKFDNLLFVNTDGNVDNTTSPVVRITDTVTVEGRLTKRKLAWSNFLDLITELEKKQNTFEVIAVDLIEDLYEYCRLYTYDKLGISHESDSGFGKGWDIVRTEFLSTMKRLKNIGYQIIYISKEVSNEVTLKSGIKYTTYKPNLADKVANVLAGTVDLTARIYLDKDKRYIQLNKDENTFGGGRFNFKIDKCKLDISEFKQVLEVSQTKEVIK